MNWHFMLKMKYVTEKLKTNIGLRSTLFSLDNRSFTSLEPRISARYLINDVISVKAAYSYMQQYVHLLTNSGASLPTDLWVPVTDSVKPMKSWQVALGLAVNLTRGLELTAESYYKKLTDVIEYKEGASYFDATGGWEDKIEMGMGYTYGFELLLQKQEGNTKGWLGYTLAWSNRKFENISEGKIFPFKYDKRHDLTIAMTHTFKNKLDLGVTWVYGSGYPFSFGEQKYNTLLPILRNQPYYDSDFKEYIEKRNNYRLPNYHRLDIGLTKHKIKKKTERIFSFGAYNIYNKQNAIFVFLDTDYIYDQNGIYEVKKIKQVSMFQIIPYIRYTINFFIWLFKN